MLIWHVGHCQGLVISEFVTHAAPRGKQGRRLKQSALVAGGAVPLATGAAAAGSLLATFLQGGIDALNALSTSLTNVASAVSTLLLTLSILASHSPVHIPLGLHPCSPAAQALAGQAVALVEKVAPAAVAAVQAAVTAGAAIKAKVAGTATGAQEVSLTASRSR